jgi:hypothetical protein
VGLFFIWIQTVFKCPHRCILLGSLELVKFPSADGRQFTPISEARCPLAALGGELSLVQLELQNVVKVGRPPPGGIVPPLCR